MISPIQLTANMTQTQMATAVNNTLQQIESENRTKVIKDENGQNRIVIGRMPDGTYGIVISNPGVNVYDIFPVGA